MTVKCVVHVLSSLMLCGMLATVACTGVTNTGIDVDDAGKGDDDAPEWIVGVEEEKETKKNNDVVERDEESNKGKDVDTFEDDDYALEEDVEVNEGDMNGNQRETVSNEEKQEVEEFLEMGKAEDEKEEKEREDAEDEDEDEGDVIKRKQVMRKVYEMGKKEKKEKEKKDGKEEKDINEKKKKVAKNHEMKEGEEVQHVEDEKAEEEEKEEADAEDEKDEDEDEDEEDVNEENKLTHDWKVMKGGVRKEVGNKKAVEEEEREENAINDEKEEVENGHEIEKKEERHDKIYGGSKTSVSRFPYIVSVQLRDEHYCAGSLIQVDWVLTAAHCLVNVYLPGVPMIPVEDYAVIAGQTDVMNPEDPGTSKHAVFANYPNQMYVDRINVSHDIGLMHLKTPLTLTKTIQLTRRPPLLSFDKEKPKLCTVVGWSSITSRQQRTVGKMYRRAFQNDVPSSSLIFDEQLFITQGTTEKSVLIYPATVGLGDQPMGDVLNYMETRPVGYKKCQAMVSAMRPYVYLLNGTVICASDLVRGNDTCQGDAGGPVVCNGYQMGVTSWSVGCDRAGLAGVYTRVDYYLEWIDAVMTTAPDVRGDALRRGRRRPGDETSKWKSSAARQWTGNLVGLFTVFAGSFVLVIVIK